MAHKFVYSNGTFRRGSINANLDVFELRKILGYGGADVQLVLFGNDHRGYGGKGLRQGFDAEDGVLLHWRPERTILKADGVMSDDFAVVQNQKYSAGDFTFFDIGGDGLPGGLQTFGSNLPDAARRRRRLR